MYLHVCETQHTRMLVTDTTATPNGHQMAVVTCDLSIETEPWFCAWKFEKVQKLSFTHLAITGMEFQKYDSYDFL